MFMCACYMFVYVYMCALFVPCMLHVRKCVCLCMHTGCLLYVCYMFAYVFMCMLHISVCCMFIYMCVGMSVLMCYMFVYMFIYS